MILPKFSKKMHEITKKLGLRSATACGLMYYRDTVICGDFLYLSICNVPSDTMCYVAHKWQNMLQICALVDLRGMLSISCSFWEILAKSCIAPPPGQLAPRPGGNPGSATDMAHYLSLILFNSYTCFSKN